MVAELSDMFRKRGAKDNTRYIPGDLWLSSFQGFSLIQVQIYVSETLSISKSSAMI